MVLFHTPTTYMMPFQVSESNTILTYVFIVWVTIAPIVLPVPLMLSFIINLILLHII